MEATELARLQFALLAAVHFLFVLLTLGPGPVVAIFDTRWVRAKVRVRVRRVLLRFGAGGASGAGGAGGMPGDEPQPEVAR